MTTLLEKVKANLILEHDADDELLGLYITAATRYAESYQHRTENYYSTNAMPPTTEQAVIIGDLDMQLDFLCEELLGYPAVLKTLKSAANVKEASDIVLTQFERPADQRDTAKDKRAAFGQTFFDKYARVKTETPTKTLYRVQVGAFSVKANANAMLQKVKAAGFTDAFITQTTK